MTGYKHSYTAHDTSDSTLSDPLNQLFSRSLRSTSLYCSCSPTCLRSATIIPVQKDGPGSLHDCRPDALTPIMTKSSERLLLSHIKAAIPAVLDQHQLAYWTNVSTEDVVHAGLTHLD